MRFIKLFWVTVLFLNFTTLSFCQTNCKGLGRFVFINPEHKNVYKEIYLKGKSIVPCLINLIDTNKKSIVGFIDPYSSTRSDYQMNNYIGINAAYLIELILSKDCLKKKYKIFRQRTLARVVSGTPVLLPLEIGDMKKIKAVYQQWWNANKNKSLRLLREVWQRDKYILDKYNYKWI